MIDDDKALETYVPLGSPDTSSDITSSRISSISLKILNTHAKYKDAIRMCTWCLVPSGETERVWRTRRVVSLFPDSTRRVCVRLAQAAPIHAPRAV